MSSTPAIHDTVAIAIAISDAVAPFVSDIAVARSKVRPVSTGAFGDISLGISQVREPREDCGSHGEVDGRHGECGPRTTADGFEKSWMNRVWGIGLRSEEVLLLD